MCTSPDQKTAQYFQMLRDIYDISEKTGVKSYVWGGFAVDILSGRLSRKHGDLDCFTEDLTLHVDELKNAYAGAGYEVKYLEDFWMLQIKKGEVHAGFNAMDNIDGIIHWRHIGRHGTVFFPVDWLDVEPREFSGVRAYTAGAKLLYAIKSHAELLNPEWKQRDKDIADLAVLKDILLSQGVSEKEIFPQIWGHNPFWYKRGYKEYFFPVLIATEE